MKTHERERLVEMARALQWLGEGRERRALECVADLLNGMAAGNENKVHDAVGGIMYFTGWGKGQEVLPV